MFSSFMNCQVLLNDDLMNEKISRRELRLSII